MPVTVNEIFESINVQEVSQIEWGNNPQLKEPGVYVISLSDNPDQNNNTISEPLFDNEQTINWFRKCNDLKMDGQKLTNFKTLQNRLSEFWLPDENILYIGKAGTSLQKRVNQYYITEIGAGGPHSGGQWLKVLSNLDKCFVYYAETEKPGKDESALLKYFAENISDSTKEKLRDPDMPLPFANIRHGGDKQHGLTNQRL